MIKKELIEKLKGTKILDDLDCTEFVHTGSYALNRIISGDYGKGIPIGGITQIRGDSSTGKTLFVSTILAQAQKAGYYTKILDTENTLNASFARMLGINPDDLMYSTPEYLEKAFEDVEETIKAIRETDTKTPIVIAIDSVAVLGTKAEYEKDTFEQSPTDGAIRAKVFGGCLRKINPILKRHNVALIVVNQVRTKINVMYGDPSTIAGGGRSLEFYLSVDLKTTSNKGSDVIKDENGNALGIEGKIECKKNKISIPFKSCGFKVLFNKGLDPYAGLLDLLVEDGMVSKSANGRYSMGEIKFLAKEFNELLLDKSKNDFAIIRNKLNIT